MAKNEKVVLILERSSENLKSTKDGNDVILEGIFAQFGVVNNNERIYEEDEYLPHLEYLNKKIQEKRLIGELDHPEKFDISLSNISHVIESLNYDKEKRQLTGRVRLLDTPQGRIAKELVESGIPISISSRAAGLVESDKKVKIKKIFTYDLVADPGFENAVLSKMNESLGILNEHVAIYDMTTEYPELLEEYCSSENKEKCTNANMDYVTSEEMNTYSLILKEEIDEIHKKLKGLNESKGGEFQDTELSEKIQKMNESIGTIEKYFDYLSSTLNDNVKLSRTVSEKLDETINLTNNVSTILEESLKLSKVNEQEIKTVTGYTSYLKEQIVNGISYSDYLLECIEEGVSYSEYISKESTITHKKINEKLDLQSRYTEYVVNETNDAIDDGIENVEKGIKYTEYSNKKLTEELNDTISYSEYANKKIVEELNTTISYTDHLKENINKGISYTEYVKEQAEQIADFANFSINEKDEKVNESVTSLDYNTIDSKIDSLIESVKKQKTEDANIKLEEAKKQKVSDALNESNQSASDKELNKLLSNKDEDNKSLNWLTDAPEEFKKVWESLDSNTQEAINGRSKSYRLESAYQIKNFWEVHANSVIEKSLEKVVAPINEAKLPSLGYGKNYLEQISAGLDKYGK